MAGKEEARTARLQECDAAQIEARYTNYFEIGHNAFEFMLDFGQYYPAAEAARMHSRIVTGPAYAKLLSEMLVASVQRFEREHGFIQPAEEELDPLDFVKESLAGYDHRLMARTKPKEE